MSQLTRRRSHGEPPADDAAVLDAVVAVREAAVRARAARSERDRAIIEAVGVGASGTAVALAAGVTRSRISQIAARPR